MDAPYAASNPSRFHSLFNDSFHYNYLFIYYIIIYLIILQELSRKFPDSCLVREGVKAYVARSDNVDAVGERWRTLPVGELLVLVGEVTAPGLPYSNRSSSTSRQVSYPSYLS